MESICIYGGGNIAHSLVAVISATQPVTVVTRRPELWNSRMSFMQDGKLHEGLNAVSATSDVGAVSVADIVFVALPQFAIDGAIVNLMSSLRPGSTVVFTPGPAKAAEYAKLLVDKGCSVVGMQRVPFISRINEYGCSVTISAPRQTHKLAVSEYVMREDWSYRCNTWFGGNVEYLSSFLTFVFSNSNPLLHPARLVELLNGGDKGRYDDCPYFYAQWTNPSSDLYIAADIEMHECFKACDPIGAQKDYESVMDHYCVGTSAELTDKIRSIQAFKGIKAPWVRNNTGEWVPDFASRYFIEDVPFGTMAIQSYAKKFSVKIPTIDYMIETIMSFQQRNHY